jgi:subtilase family serine protease
MYCEVKILIYPRRGVYVAKNRDEQYQMLKVILNTLCSDELATTMKMSRSSEVVYHDDECVIEVAVPHAKANVHDEKAMQELLHKVNDLGNEYSWEVAVLPDDHAQRKSVYNASKNVLNPLMQIKPIIEVSL